jgi:hypothetical protein
MDVERGSQSESVSVDPCPACGQAHVFNFTAIIDEVVGVMHMMLSRTETKTCGVSCPVTSKRFAVDVPVMLFSGQALVYVR